MPTIALPFAADHPVFPGHFPSQPIVPGVLLLDWAQAAIEAALGQPLQALTEAKFHGPATPDDSLTMDYDIGTVSARFEIHTTDRRKIASGRFGLPVVAEQ